MSGKQKIENLTNAWYGYVVTSAVISFLAGSWGLISIFFSGVGLFISLFITWAIGKSLLGRSSLMRFVLLCWTGLSTVAGSIGVARSSLYLLDSFSFKLVGILAWACVGIYMMGRSFMTLVSGDVKTYFR